MTLTCPGMTCPMCTGDHCAVCRAVPCSHDVEERHGRLGYDSLVVDVETPPSPRTLTPRQFAESRTPTVPLTTGRIEVDIEDAEAAAEFLELVARSIRSKRKLTLVVE